MSDKEKPVNHITPESILNKMARDKEARNEHAAKFLERVEDYKTVVNRLFSTPDGLYFLNDLIDYCGINSFDKELNPAKLIEDRGKRKVFLEMIRPYLDKIILQQLG